MPDTIKIIIVFAVMLVLLFYARKYRAMQMQKAGISIINDLKSKGALDPSSAVELPYARRNFFRVGFRDDRPRLIRQMVQMGLVGVTENGRFYLNESQLPKS